MKLEDVGLVFPQEYLRAALMVSLLSVWVLVGLFFYLHRYNRSDCFNMWRAAWFFYAAWLTLSVRMGDPGVGSFIFTLKQCFISISAVFLLWGSLRFLGYPVAQRLLGVFMLFLAVWICVCTQVVLSVLLVEIPVFVLLTLNIPFAAMVITRLRREKAFVGASMLCLGFLLWGIYLGSYPFAPQYGRLFNAGFFGAVLLQFFLAAGMIVLIWDEIRSRAEQVRAESAAIRLEKILWKSKSASLKGGDGSSMGIS
jgi:hypothetical protein